MLPSNFLLSKHCRYHSLSFSSRSRTLQEDFKRMTDIQTIPLIDTLDASRWSSPLIMPLSHSLFPAIVLWGKAAFAACLSRRAELKFAFSMAIRQPLPRWLCCDGCIDYRFWYTWHTHGYRDEIDAIASRACSLYFSSYGSPFYFYLLLSIIISCRSIGHGRWTMDILLPLPVLMSAPRSRAYTRR